MLSSSKITLAAAAALGGAAAICPLCGGGPGIAGAQPEGVRMTRTADTAVVSLRISRMTCGSCATTARIALQRLTGVHSAVVTYDEGLGVVHYDPRRITPAEIAAHLTELTGFGASILPDGGSPESEG